MQIFRPILSEIEKLAQEGLKEVAENVLAESNRRAPRDDGDLIASGRTGVDDLRANVAYKSFYATWIHERLDWKHDDGGEAKFLENAVEATKAENLQILGRAMRRLGSG